MWDKFIGFLKKYQVIIKIVFVIAAVLLWLSGMDEAGMNVLIKTTIATAVAIGGLIALILGIKKKP